MKPVVHLDNAMGNVARKLANIKGADQTVQSVQQLCYSVSGNYDG